MADDTTKPDPKRAAMLTMGQGATAAAATDPEPVVEAVAEKEETDGEEV
jgi:hypothetical protein